MSAPLSPPSAAPHAPPASIPVRALLLGERIDIAGLERADALSAVPLAFRAGQGFAVIFRYGAIVLVGLSPIEEDEFVRRIEARITGRLAHAEDETAQLRIVPETDDQVAPDGVIQVRDLSAGRLVVVADALAKSVALARDEREVARVFDVVDPVARRLAETGRTPGRRRELMRLIGQALLVQQRVAGRVAVEEKPDVLWDRPDLERLYARLGDEYEITERAIALTRKLTVIDESARAFTDLIDTERSIRLEWAIVLLIVFEIVMTLWEKLMR
jgi:uncharacterized Rmd1/YagE family protein